MCGWNAKKLRILTRKDTFNPFYWLSFAEKVSSEMEGKRIWNRKISGRDKSSKNTWSSGICFESNFELVGDSVTGLSVRMFELKVPMGKSHSVESMNTSTDRLGLRARSPFWPPEIIPMLELHWLKPPAHVQLCCCGGMIHAEDRNQPLLNFFGIRKKERWRSSSLGVPKRWTHPSRLDTP